MKRRFKIKTTFEYADGTRQTVEAFKPYRKTAQDFALAEELWIARHGRKLISQEITEVEG